MTINGGSGSDHKTLAFLPWLVLPEPTQLAGYIFSPWSVASLDQPFGLEFGQSLSRIVGCYVDLKGQVIDSCTVIANRTSGWNISITEFKQVEEAVGYLGLAVMAERRFYEVSARYTNGLAFRPILQKISSERPDDIAVLSRRQGSIIKFGGLRHKDVLFQAPLSLETSKSPMPKPEFLTALDSAWQKESSFIKPLRAALPFWLLANSDELSEGHQSILNATAFEQLFSPLGSQKSHDLSEKLGSLFQQFGTVKLAGAKMPDPRWKDEQSDWYLHQKWIKELYESRSAQVHQGSKSEYSQNWRAEHHAIIAAFVFPLSVKLLLQRDGYYSTSFREQGACRALDKLLEASDEWQEKWAEILSDEECSAELRASIEAVMEQAGPVLD